VTPATTGQIEVIEGQTFQEIRRLLRNRFNRYRWRFAQEDARSDSSL